MNVGVVLCLPEGVSVLGRAQLEWEQWRTAATSSVLGPIPAKMFTTFPVALQAGNNAKPGTVSVYVGANRGRGQAYPNGSVSNLVSSRWDTTGTLAGQCVLAKRLGVTC